MTGMGERKIDRSGRETETERGRETGEKEKKLQTLKNSWNFILSCYTPQNGSIRLPGRVGSRGKFG